jgi:hypothetical protein
MKKITARIQSFRNERSVIDMAVGIINGGWFWKSSLLRWFQMSLCRLSDC